MMRSHILEPASKWIWYSQISGCPGSLDGLQLAEILHDDYPDIPVILTSGNPPPGHVGIVEAFVPKPYDVRETIALMSAVLALKSPGELL
jgi:CheY-like chemotaxis protein